MEDLKANELRDKLKGIAERSEGAGLVAKFYSADVLVVCLPLDEEKGSETERQGTPPPSLEGREGRDRGGQSTLL